MNIKTLIRTSFMALSVAVAPMVVGAQNLFSAAILVNDQAITNYELNQRTMFLEALRFPGVPDELAPKQLIEERLKRQPRINWAFASVKKNCNSNSNLLPNGLMWPLMNLPLNWNAWGFQ